jgi:hypothetical protein
MRSEVREAIKKFHIQQIRHQGEIWLLMYKACNYAFGSSYFSSRGPAYRPGTYVVASDFSKSRMSSCGYGLHIWPTIKAAKSWALRSERILRVGVRADHLVVPYAAIEGCIIDGCKMRCKELVVIEEVVKEWITVNSQTQLTLAA